MRVLHILDHSIPLHSGYAFRSGAIIEQQRARGWDTAQITSAKHRPPAAPEETVDGLHFYRTNPGRGALARLPLLNQMEVIRSLIRRLDEVIALERPDILHAHSPALNGMAGLAAARRHGLPLVYECRAFWEDAAVDHGSSSVGGLRYRATRAMESYVFRRADAVTTICEGLRGDIVARGVPAEKVTVIPNAVDLAQFAGTRRPDPGLAERLGLAGHPVVGFIGSFYAYEGLHVLLRSLPRLAQSCPEIRVLLVGGGPEEASLRNQARDPDLRDRVVFAGRVPHDEVSLYYDLLDILVYPRMHMRLTDLVTPLKPLEAMAQRRLVVASDVGGHRELIRDGETGCLFKAGEPAALADVLAALLLHRDRWPPLIERGRQYVETERTWVASVARYSSIYARLADIS